MTQLYQIYKCEVCGNVVEVLHTGAGELVCCNQPMKLLEENTEDTATEKHVPIIEELPANVCEGKDGVIIKVGEVDHPMNDDHYIEWIEIIPEDGKRGKRFLKPGDSPQVEFYTRKKIVGARAYCNLHGLWKNN
ncbi:MAG: desulfoferrodoxin [Patescibacteria group bacterium]